MPIVKDIAGQKFGRLTAIAPNGKRGRMTKWDCECDCGALVNVAGDKLRNGHTKSCGCLQIEAVRKSGLSNLRHGKSHTKVHNAWHGCQSRCYNPNMESYPNYGGRGISVCDRWRNSFEAFYEDMGEPPSPKHSLHRVNNDGNYEPSNCIWATHREQSEATSKTHNLTLEGRTMCISRWSELLDIPLSTLWNRIRRGWAVEPTLLIPPHMTRGTSCLTRMANV